jgi:hypothetical protein
MTTHVSYERAEVQMRRLLEENDLPEPDEVLRNDGELILLWNDQQLAVVVELGVGSG